MKKYFIYQDTEQWIPLFNWFWYEIDAKGQPINLPGTDGMGHGGYPAKWIATLSAWRHTR